MASPPKPDVTIVPHKMFSVSSGALCFGSTYDIWDGAAAPIQDFPEVRPQPGGTVIVHAIKYNVRAYNGTWNVYQLVDVDTGEVTAWFAALDTVDPWSEVDRILRISGSPYEWDSGDSMNTERTTAESVFVINRYDWCGPRKNHDLDTYIQKNESHKDDTQDDTDASERLHGTAALLVDKDLAKDTVVRWMAEKNYYFTDAAAFCFIPGGEYNFGRFGFDDQRRAARSFIYFTTNTVFTRTTFAGLTQPLRIEETGEEFFNRQIREGRDMSGLETLRRMTKPSPPGFPPQPDPPPTTAELFGPFKADEYILTDEDMEALRDYSRNQWITEPHTISTNGIDITSLVLQSPESQFEPTWQSSLLELINELALSFVLKSILPLVAEGYPLSSAVEALLPRHRDPQPNIDNIDPRTYPFFTKPNENSIPNFNIAAVAERMRRFLEPRIEQASDISENVVLGASRTLAFFLAMVLDSAWNGARDSCRPRMIPSDIRVAIINYRALKPFLGYSKVYWEGGNVAQIWPESRAAL